MSDRGDTNNQIIHIMRRVYMDFLLHVDTMSSILHACIRKTQENYSNYLDKHTRRIVAGYFILFFRLSFYTYICLHMYE